MAITYRLLKGSPLTHQELDDNFRLASSSLAALEAATGSFLYSGSFDGSTTLTLYSGDVNYNIDLSSLGGGGSDLTALNLFTGSIQTEVNNLTAETGSYLYSGSFSSTDNVITLYSGNQNYELNLNSLTGSTLISASVSNNIITFEKGDGTTFNITVNTGSGVGGGTTDYVSNVRYNTGSIQFTGVGDAFSGRIDINDLTASLISNDQTSSFVTNDQTGSFVTNDETGSFMTTGSVTDNTITFTKGDGTTFEITVDTGSGGAFDVSAAAVGELLFKTSATSADGKHVKQYYADGSYGKGVTIGNTHSTNDGLNIYETSNDPQSYSEDHIILSDSSGSDLIIRNGGKEAGDGYIFLKVDEPGLSGTTFNVAKLGGPDKSVILYHSGSNVFRTEYIGSDASVIISGSISGSKDVFFSGLPNTITANIVGFDTATGQLSYYDTGSFGGGSATDITDLNNFTGSIQTEVNNLTAATGSYLYSGSYDSGTNVVTLYSDNQNYDLDLSGLAGGGGGGFAITASNEGSVLTQNARSFDFAGNGVTATNTGNAVTVTVTQANTSSFVTNDQTSSFVTNDQTSSFVTNDETGSFLTTGSVTDNTITFTKGDGTTFEITVDTGSGGGGSTDYVSNVVYQTGSIDFTGVGSGFDGVIQINDLTGSLINNSQTSSMFVGAAVNTSITVKNKHTGTIAKGTPCYITGSGTSGNVVGVVPADAVDGTYMPAGVVLAEELTNPGDEGTGYINGWINGVDTSAFEAGDNIYVAVGGGYTNVKPTGSALIQKLGNVEKIHVSNGSGVIVGAGRANDLPNINPGHFWVGDSDWVPQAVSTSSFVTTSSFNDATGSFMTTGSVSGSVLTFTKGDGTTFDITIVSSSYAASSSHSPNLYNSDGTLEGNRRVTANTHNLSFNFADANWIINTDPGVEVQINNLNASDAPQVIGYSDGVLTAMNTSSIASGGGGTPDTPLNSLQFNSASAFGGSELYYDEANIRLGINVASPLRALHVSSSSAQALRLESTVAENQYIQFFPLGASGAGSLIGGVNVNDFGILNTDGGIQTNQYVSASGEIFFPRIAAATRSNVVGYDTATGELTYQAAGGGSDLPVSSSGTGLTSAATSIDFVGNLVNTTVSSDDVTVTVNSGSVNQVNLVGATADADYRVLLVDGDGMYDETLYVDNNNGLTFNPSLDFLQVKGEVIAYYASDRSLKDNVTPIADPLQKLESINGYEFDWNDNQGVYEGHDIGVIAQEIEEVLPELVTTRESGVKAVKYEKLTAFLISVVKEQQNQIEDLKTRVENLEK